MAGVLRVRVGASWAGAEVTGCTRMPDGRVAVCREGASTVLAEPELLLAGGVLDRRTVERMLADT